MPAPLGVIRLLLLEQITGFDTLEIPTVGVVFTLIVAVMVFVLVQPPLDPIIEYVVVLDGVTLKLVPVAPVFNNVYVVAPLGVISAELLEHILEFETLEIPTVGPPNVSDLVKI